MKVAILLGGQRRFTKQSIDLIVSNIISPLIEIGLEVDIFCLYKIAKDGDFFSRPSLIKRCPDRDVIIYSNILDEYFVEKIKPIVYANAIYIEPTNFPKVTLKHKHVSKKYTPNFFNLAENLKNLLSYEDKISKRYDILMKLRIDINYITAINPNDIINLEENTLLIPMKEAHVVHGTEANIYNDQTWICKRNMGLRLFNIFNELTEDMVTNVGDSIEQLVLDFIQKELKGDIRKISLNNTFERIYE